MGLASALKALFAPGPSAPLPLTNTGASPADLLRNMREQRDEALKFLSHDMRSPNSSILSLIELHRLGAAEVKDVPALLQRIERYARTGLELSEDFLNLARARAGDYELDEEDLYFLLGEAADQIWSQARERHIRIELPDLQSSAPARVNRALMTRALSILIENAVKASPDGTTIHCDVLAAGEGDAWWQVSVRDEGPGIEAQDIDVMFEKFRSETGDPRVEGNEMALAFVKAVVTGHGGTVSALNCTEQGAEFRVCLPKNGPLTVVN